MSGFPYFETSPIPTGNHAMSGYVPTWVSPSGFPYLRQAHLGKSIRGSAGYEEAGLVIRDFEQIRRRYLLGAFSAPEKKEPWVRDPGMAGGEHMVVLEKPREAAVSFLKRRMVEKNGEFTPRSLHVCLLWFSG